MARMNVVPFKNNAQKAEDEAQAAHASALLEGQLATEKADAERSGQIAQQVSQTR